MFRDSYPLSWFYHRNSTTIVDGESHQPEVNLFDAKEYDKVPLVRLPPPLRQDGDLAGVIEGRRSCREFDQPALSLEQVSTILMQSYGLGRAELSDGFERCRRPVPSAGALYPLELYVIVNRVEGLESGIYHYGLVDHSLERLTNSPVPSNTLAELFLAQDYAASASVIIVMTAVFARSMRKYGDRGYRYILIEAGHVGQNAMLSCENLELASLALGGFLDAPLADLLGIDAGDELPIYAIAVGRR
jgi:SagB-type dehydrogenase family enzyme